MVRKGSTVRVRQRACEVLLSRDCFARYRALQRTVSAVVLPSGPPTAMRAFADQHVAL